MLLGNRKHLMSSWTTTRRRPHLSQRREVGRRRLAVMHMDLAPKGLPVVVSMYLIPEVGRYSMFTPGGVGRVVARLCLNSYCWVCFATCELVAFT
mmetsp:Transcript_96447/g.312356  ORF Transcript_96447/g.312356 Transcript_96447/m.312356 type:complete len:95 (-) Transcript_96447:40-324(-)